MCKYFIFYYSHKPNIPLISIVPTKVLAIHHTAFMFWFCCIFIFKCCKYIKTFITFATYHEKYFISTLLVKLFAEWLWSVLGIINHINYKRSLLIKQGAFCIYTYSPTGRGSGLKIHTVWVRISIGVRKVKSRGLGSCLLNKLLWIGVGFEYSTFR